MNKEQVVGKFDAIKGKIKQEWAKLTDDDIMLFNGKQDEFFGKLKEKHGIIKEDAEKAIKKFEDAVSADNKAA